MTFEKTKNCVIEEHAIKQQTVVKGCTSQRGLNIIFAVYIYNLTFDNHHVLGSISKVTNHAKILQMKPIEARTFLECLLSRPSQHCDGE